MLVSRRSTAYIQPAARRLLLARASLENLQWIMQPSIGSMVD